MPLAQNSAPSALPAYPIYPVGPADRTGVESVTISLGPLD
jgi:hypothetical protein